jgi:hypothetical protein
MRIKKHPPTPDKPVYQLKNWTREVHSFDNDTVWYKGNVYGHTAFENGTYIHTSKCLREEGDYIRTLNSHYVLVDEGDEVE